LSRPSAVSGDKSRINSDDLIPNEKTVLRRELGLFSGVCFIMGVIIGKYRVYRKFISYVLI